MSENNDIIWITKDNIDSLKTATHNFYIIGIRKAQSKKTIKEGLALGAVKQYAKRKN